MTNDQRDNMIMDIHSMMGTLTNDVKRHDNSLYGEGDKDGLCTKVINQGNKIENLETKHNECKKERKEQEAKREQEEKEEKNEKKSDWKWVAGLIVMSIPYILMVIEKVFA